MSQTLAIVGNTWKQSQRQVVFIITGCLVLVVVAAALFIGRSKTDSHGNKYFGTVFQSGDQAGRSRGYDEFKGDHERDRAENAEKSSAPVDGSEAPNKTGNAQSAKPSHRDEQANGSGLPPSDGGADRAAEVRLPQSVTKPGGEVVSLHRAGVEGFLWWTIMWLILVAALGFIAASAGYFPDMLSSGAIDVVVARPISRTRVFFAKYLGGLALYAAMVSGAFLLLFLGVGVLWGEWVPRLFLALPLILFSGALLYAIVAFFGILSRGVALPMVLGYVLYVVVDLLMVWVIGLQMQGEFGDSKVVNTLVDGVRYGLPNFVMLNWFARNSLFSLDMLEWQPFITAGCWLVAMLGLGWWKFRRTDY